MRLYVEYRFVVPVEVDDDMYEECDMDEFIQCANADPDFHEVLPDDPIPFVECDYEVLDLDSAKWYEGEPATRAFSVTRANPQVGDG